eukprot:NODE_808_length_3768_cov_1.295176.p2 type:complete len:301 gc:universal NODE_808_length_3768_cov_1.295176:554-1456(+)
MDLPFVTFYLFLRYLYSELIFRIFCIPRSRNILIVGCSSGIGKEMAGLLCQNFNIILASRKIKDLERLKLALKSKSVKNIAIRHLDIRNIQDFQQLFLDCETLVGKIDTVVVAAGVFDLHNLKDADYFSKSKYMIETNFYGPMALYLEFERYTTQNLVKHPYFLVISSIAAESPFYNSTTYSLSKKSIENFLSMKSKENSSISITVVRQGYAKTKLTEWTNTIPFSITALQSAQDIVYAMKRRCFWVTVPLYPWNIATKLSKLIPIMLINRLIKYEFELNTKNNEKGIEKLKKHIYNEDL